MDGARSRKQMHMWSMVARAVAAAAWTTLMLSCAEATTAQAHASAVAAGEELELEVQGRDTGDVSVNVQNAQNPSDPANATAAPQRLSIEWGGDILVVGKLGAVHNQGASADSLQCTLNRLYGSGGYALTKGACHNHYQHSPPHHAHARAHVRLTFCLVFLRWDLLVLTSHVQVPDCQRSHTTPTCL